MAIIGNFDGTNKRLYLSATGVVGGVLSFNAVDFYSEIVEWFNGPATAPYNDRFIRPMRAVGGDSKGGSARVGTTTFLMSDWQIGFPDQNLLVIVEGELLLDQATNTNGQRFYYGNLSPSSRVNVELQTPTYNEVIEVSSNGVISSSFTTDDRAKLEAINTNVNTLLERVTAQRAQNLDALPAIADDAAALARGNISVNTTANTLTLHKPDGTVHKTFNLTNENDVATIVGALQRTGQ
ncbi:MAG: hypothetical protein ACFB0G_11175 [Leptolyngbyaceae cyanobacterium]